MRLNRLFLVLTLLWAVFCAVVYPLRHQWIRQQRAAAEHRREDEVCAVLVENPEWSLTKNCYLRSWEDYQDRLRVLSFKNSWVYVPLAREFFLFIIMVPPIIAYGVGLAAWWARNRLVTE